MGKSKVWPFKPVFRDPCPPLIHTISHQPKELTAGLVMEGAACLCMWCEVSIVRAQMIVTLNMLKRGQGELNATVG